EEVTHIQGVGESTSVILVIEGLVKDVADLYYMKREDLIKLERMAEKSVTNVLDAVEKSKDTPLARVIFGLGIRHVGIEMAQVLTQEFPSLDDLAKATREELASIPTIGPKIADSIVAFFKQKENVDIIERLRGAGVRLEEEVVKPEELPLAGQEFVITGRLEAFSRQEAEARVKALGGTTKDNVTRQTTYLVAGADPGSKLTRARALGIKQLTEEEFLHRLEGEI
ncbi:helix-hairpin-helix domain-containing protein, partial [Chloroflexota bacterium]